MFNIVVKETKEFLRDKTNLFFFLMFPALLVFLLGNLLSSMDQAEETIGEIKIQYLVETDNPYQVMAIETFVQSAGDNKNLVFKKINDLEASKQLAAKDEIAAVVVFTGDPMEIQVYEGSNHVKNRTVSAIMNSFVQTNKSIAAIVLTAPEQLMGLNVVQEEYIQQKNLGINRTMIDYYAVSMVAMIAFLSMMVGAGAFASERQNKTINRLIIAPQNRVFMFIQKILGLLPQIVLQIGVIMVTSVFLFKAHYAQTVQNNLYLFLMFIAVTLSMVAVGAVIGLVIKKNPTVIIMPILWIMMFVGGTYSKEINIKGLTQAMPIYQIQQAAFDLAIFGRFDKANKVIGVSIIILLVALVFGAILFNRKEEER